MPIIRSSRVLYKWLLPVVFGAWFEGCVSGLQAVDPTTVHEKFFIFLYLINMNILFLVQDIFYLTLLPILTFS
jgi:hypothetical protein